MSLQLGAGFAEDFKGTLDSPSLPDSAISISLDPGFSGEVALGYRWGNFRTDLSAFHGRFGSNSITYSTPFGEGSSRAQGTMAMTAVLLNGYIDLPNRLRNGEQSRWRPYLGGGIGYAAFSTPDCGSDCFQGGSDGAFAWQGKVGLSYRAKPQGALFLELGYLGTGPSRVDATDFDGFGTWRLSLGWRQGLGSARPRPDRPTIQAPAGQAPAEVPPALH